MYVPATYRYRIHGWAGNYQVPSLVSEETFPSPYSARSACTAAMLRLEPRHHGVTQDWQKEAWRVGDVVLYFWPIMLSKDGVTALADVVVATEAYTTPDHPKE